MTLDYSSHDTSGPVSQLAAKDGAVSQNRGTSMETPKFYNPQ